MQDINAKELKHTALLVVSADNMDRRNVPLWYFCYGSNMAQSVFTKKRRINPLCTKVATIKDYVLAFNVLQMPYSEPGMAGIRRRTSDDDTKGTPSVVGVVYQLCESDLARVIATEGGGIAYTVIEVEAVLIEDDSPHPILVWTLVPRMPHPVERLPSSRYMGLLISGAAEQNLPSEYRAFLAVHATLSPSPGRRYAIGKRLFQTFWLPVGFGLQWSLQRLVNSEGVAPVWFVAVVGFLSKTMWLWHDYVHSKIWGRGDGLV